LPQPTGVSPFQNGPPIAQQPIPSALTLMSDGPKFLEKIVSMIPGFILMLCVDTSDGPNGRWEMGLYNFR
jgi:hypothetical protein